MRRYLLPLLLVLALVAPAWAAQQTTPYGLIIPPTGLFSALPAWNLATWPLNAAGYKVGFVFRCQKSGNIAKIGWHVGNVTTSESVDIRLETLAGAHPSGTLVNASSYATRASVVSDTYYLEDLGAGKGAVTLGTFYAVVIQPTSFVALNIAFARINAPPPTLRNTFYADYYTTAWAAQWYVPALVLEYDDGTYMQTTAICPASGLGCLTYTSGSAANTVAAKFSLPFPDTLSGIILDAQFTATTAFDVKITSNAGANWTTLASLTGASLLPLAGNFTPTEIRFATPFACAANTNYRLAIVPTTTNNVTIGYIAVTKDGTSNPLSQWPGGVNFIWSQGSSPTTEAAWTDVDTKQPTITGVFGGFDDGASAGGGGWRPFMQQHGY